MAKILAPNKQYDGISAGIKFTNGVGECTDPYLINWFTSKGYVVEEAEIDVVEEAEEKQEVKPAAKSKKK